jgi:Protein of unknown function (DUF3467)
MDDDAVVWLPPNFEGKYANCFRVGSNRFELIIDFAQCGPDNRIAIVHTRIIVSPVHGKVLLNLLQKSIDDVEMQWGSQGN